MALVPWTALRARCETDALPASARATARVAPRRNGLLARIFHHVACANNKCSEYQLLVSDSQGVGMCKLRWPRPRRSFGPVRALKRVGARATSTVGPLCFSVASTRTGPKSSNAPARARIIAARGEKCGLGSPQRLVTFMQGFDMAMKQFQFQSTWRRVTVRNRSSGGTPARRVMVTIRHRNLTRVRAFGRVQGI